MKLQIPLFIGSALFLTALAQATETRPIASLVIENVTVLSPHKGQPDDNRDVLIVDGRIKDIISSGSNYPAESRIDGRGKVLIPGLIDSHVHLRHNPLINPRHIKDHQALHLAYRDQLPRSFLCYGYTSVIDLDFTPGRGGWPAHTAIAPAIYHCGRGVRVAGGYGPVFVPSPIATRVFPNLVFEPDHRTKWPDDLDPALYTVDAAVQRVAQSGAICLKTYVESGFGGIFDWPVPSRDTLSALSRAAHAEGLVFMIHATSAADWQRAMAGGADIIAHGLWHWQGDRRVADLTDEALAAIDAAIKKGIAVQPTLRVVEGEKGTMDWQLQDDPRLAEVSPASLLDYLRTRKGRWSKRALLDIYRKHNPHPEVAPTDLIATSVQRARNSLARLHRGGGRILFGTDTPAQDGIGNPPGLNGHLEMTGWAAAGIPLETIFRSATLDNARAFNLDHELGSIEPGKQADLVLLNTNPLEHIEAYDDIALVIVNGTPVDRRDLSAQSPVADNR